MFSRSSRVWHASEFPSFSRLNNIPLYVGWWGFKLSVMLHAFEPHLENMSCHRIRDARGPSGVHTFHLACHTFLTCSFSPPVSLPLLSPLLLPLFLSFSLYLSFFLLSSFLSPSPSILPFFPSFQSFLSQVGWGVDLNISLLLRSGMKGCLERGQIAVEAVNSMDLFWGALGVTFT